MVHILFANILYWRGPYPGNYELEVLPEWWQLDPSAAASFTGDWFFLPQPLQFALLIPDRGQKGCFFGRDCGAFFRVLLKD